MVVANEKPLFVYYCFVLNSNKLNGYDKLDITRGSRVCCKHLSKDQIKKGFTTHLTYLGNK